MDNLVWFSKKSRLVFLTKINSYLISNMWHFYIKNNTKWNERLRSLANSKSAIFSRWKLRRFFILLLLSPIPASHLKTTSDVTWKARNDFSGGKILMATFCNAKDTEKHRRSCFWGLTGSLALLEHQSHLGLGLQVI